MLSKPFLGIIITAMLSVFIDKFLTRLRTKCRMFLLILFLTTAFLDNFLLTFIPKKVGLVLGETIEVKLVAKIIIKHDPCFLVPCLLTRSNSLEFFREKIATQ